MVRFAQIADDAGGFDEQVKSTHYGHLVPNESNVANPM
jgi:hypothetical protein